MMRRKYGFIILFCVVLSALYVIPGFAAEWLLGEVYMEDYYQEADMESYSVASASDAAATGSDADYGIMLLSSYETFDTGSISSTVLIYHCIVHTSPPCNQGAAGHCAPPAPV